MTSIQARFSGGPRTYEAVEAITGGQLLEARSNGSLPLPGAGVAGDASKKVVGVAQKDATPGGGAPRTPTSGVLDQTLAPSELAVYGGGFFVPVKYSAACAFGAKVAAAAAGTLRPWVTADGADAIVGRCEEAAGVAQNATGLTYLY